MSASMHSRRHEAAVAIVIAVMVSFLVEIGGWLRTSAGRTIKGGWPLGAHCMKACTSARIDSARDAIRCRVASSPRRSSAS